MIIEMLSRGEIINSILTADTGDERDETYAFRDLFGVWLRDTYGMDFHTVSYLPKRLKNYPPYASLSENCLTNGTLPSIAFGRHSCSLKFKVAPQDAWVNAWEPAQRVWATGGKVIKLIGYDAGPRDSARYAEREGHASDKYLFRTPLREWGWDRETCQARIAAAGLPVPPKSACFHCTASKPFEIRALSKSKLARIIAMEARAQPRLRTVEGLWRTTTRGLRKGSVARPGRMTDFIRAEGLLPRDVIERIETLVPKRLLAFMEAVADKPVEERQGMKEWLDFFMASEELGLDGPGEDRLYGGVRDGLAATAAPPDLAA